MNNSACYRKELVTSPNQARRISSTIGLRKPCLLVTLVVTLAGLNHAFAQSDAITAEADSRPKNQYQISQQPLNTALRDFALASGLQVSFPDDIARGRTSREVAGSYTPEEALSELLAGTGLSFRFTSADTVTLERAGPSIVPLAPAATNQRSARFGR